MRMVLGSLLACVGLLGCASSPTAKPAATTEPTTRPANSIGMRHEREAFDADHFEAGTFRRATYVFEGPDTGIRLHRTRGDFPLTGVWVSDTIVPDEAFTEVLPSWNAIVPDKTGIKFEIRVRDKASDVWSPWLYIGYWGRVTTNDRVTSYDGGKVDIDTLELKKPADAYEVRVTLQDFEPVLGATPTLKALNVVTSREDKKIDIVTPLKATTQPVTIDVPYRAQGWEAESVRHSVCSPTSVSMVLEWAGVKVPTFESCQAIWDDDYALFGNWNRAVQWAGSLGLSAHLERFETMKQAREVLKKGQPIIASIRFKRGEFPSNLQKATAGHLIVLRGYDTHGDILVNDPASKDKGHGIVYKADELARAWIGSTGGVGYIIEKATTKPAAQP